MMGLASKERISEALAYDPETGVLTWKISIGKATSGTIAGTVWEYRRIGLDGHVYQAHWLVWFITHGEWPIHELDHINGDRDDNRIANLRDVTPSENNRNKRLRTDNTHGVPGVYYHRKTGVWYAQACHGGKNRHLGSFATFEEAATARREFQELNGYHPNHGRKAA